MTFPSYLSLYNLCVWNIVAELQDPDNNEKWYSSWSGKYNSKTPEIERDPQSFLFT